METLVPTIEFKYFAIEDGIFVGYTAEGSKLTILDLVRKGNGDTYISYYEGDEIRTVLHSSSDYSASNRIY